MKPVAVFRHAAHEGPGYFAEFLDERKIPWQLIAIDAGDSVPQDASAYSGLVFMGGPMSVNDGLPWIAREQALVRAAPALLPPVPLVIDYGIRLTRLTDRLGRLRRKAPVAERGGRGFQAADGSAGAATLSQPFQGKSRSLTVRGKIVLFSGLGLAIVGIAVLSAAKRRQPQKAAA